MLESAARQAESMIPDTVARPRARIALAVQQLPTLWRTYQLLASLTCVRPGDAPYLLEMLTTIRRVAPETDGGTRLLTLFRLARSVVRDEVPGDIIECGVATGGTAALMAVAARHSRKQLWLYDSFEGLPPAEAVDGRHAGRYTGACRGSMDDVRATLARMHVDLERVHLVKGWFEDTLPRAQVTQIALLHIDGDWYRSVRTTLEALYDRVAPGGYVVIDDYGYWPGCRIATDEFLRERGIRVQLVRVNAACHFRKPR